MVRFHSSTHIGVHFGNTVWYGVTSLRIIAQSVETVSILQPYYDCIPSASFSQIYNERCELSHLFLSATAWSSVHAASRTADCCHWQFSVAETESNASCNTINKQKCKSRNTQEDLTLPPWTWCHKNDCIQFVIGRNVKIIITFLSRWQSQHGSLSSRLMGHLPKVFDYLCYWRIKALWLHHQLSFMCMLDHHNKLNVQGLWDRSPNGLRLPLRWRHCIALNIQVWWALSPKVLDYLS